MQSEGRGRPTRMGRAGARGRAPCGAAHEGRRAWCLSYGAEVRGLGGGRRGVRVQKGIMGGRPWTRLCTPIARRLWQNIDRETFDREADHESNIDSYISLDGSYQRILSTPCTLWDVGLGKFKFALLLVEI